MATESKSNIPSSPSSGNPSTPRRIFAEEFLAWLAAGDEPVTALEAEVARPFHVEPDPHGGWAVLGEGESLAAGDAPVISLLRKEYAMLAASVLPGTGRRLRFQIGEDRCERGFPVLLGGSVVGHIRHFRGELVDAMTVVEALLSSPGDFAWLLEAMGATAAERVEKVAACKP
jgi:hypothetical protein